MLLQKQFSAGAWVVILAITALLAVFLILFLTWSESYPFEEQEIEAGREEIRQSRVVFAGLIRDRQDRIPYLKKRLESWAAPFKDYRILIVENDSRDQTRERLLVWAKENPKVTILGCGENAPRCSLSLAPTAKRTHGGSRIEKMAYLRNIYVDYIRQHYNDWDYLVVNDMDLVGEVSPQGWESSFGRFRQESSLGAISAYGYYDLWFKKIFYDPFALVPLH
jgi:hypothetical protein